MELSDATAAKAERLLAQRRVCLGPAGSHWAVVFGDSDRYIVRAFERGCTCTCQAGRPMRAACSHKAAAMVVWAERIGAIVEFPPEVGDQLELLVAS